MTHQISIMLAILMAPVSLSQAGVLTGGTWTPGNCGQRPQPPLVIDKTVDTYNQSIKAIDAWQKQVNDYNACVVQEANRDNERIAKAANAEQAKFKQELDKISHDAATAKAKLDK